MAMGNNSIKRQPGQVLADIVRVVTETAKNGIEADHIRRALPMIGASPAFVEAIVAEVERLRKS